MDFPVDGFGVSYHTSSSEPYFYDTACMHVKHEGAIPVDDKGCCFIACELDVECKGVKKWQCTSQRKLPNDKERASIVTTKLLFQKSVEELREGLEGIDSGGPHTHFATVDTSYSEHPLSRELMGHPLPCSKEACSPADKGQKFLESCTLW